MDKQKETNYIVNIIEDNPDTVSYLQNLLNNHESIFILGSIYSSVEHARPFFSEHCSIWIIDLGLPGESGNVALREIRSFNKNVKICMFTSVEDPFEIISAIRHGANGYLLKEINPDLLILELQSVMLGGSPLTSKVAESILLEFEKLNSNSRISSDFDTHLTDRQVEILTLISLGFNYNQISIELDIATGTVRKHIENIYKKLNVNSKIQAIQKGIQLGIIDSI